MNVIAEVSAAGAHASGPGAAASIAIGLFVVAVLLLFLLSVVCRGWWDPGSDGPSDDEPGGGLGRGGGVRPSRPSGGAPDREPEWWPDFDRAFALYVAEQDASTTVTRSKVAGHEERSQRSAHAWPLPE